MQTVANIVSPCPAPASAPHLLIVHNPPHPPLPPRYTTASCAYRPTVIHYSPINYHDLLLPPE